MDNNDLNKKLKLKQSVVEHKNLSWEGIDNGMPTVDNVTTINVNIVQSNTSKVDIPKSGERETCTHTKQILHKDNYGYFQLTEFVGRGICKLTTYSLQSFGQKQI